ncbi:MAG: hypothetical protein Q8942_17830 [Bacillota bacterium]|nr:hypothetical protein [Bacillota bacterium]
MNIVVFDDDEELEECYRMLFDKLGVDAKFTFYKSWSEYFASGTHEVADLYLLDHNLDIDNIKGDKVLENLKAEFEGQELKFLGISNADQPYLGVGNWMDKLKPLSDALGEPDLYALQFFKPDYLQKWLDAFARLDQLDDPNDLKGEQLK